MYYVLSFTRNTLLTGSDKLCWLFKLPAIVVRLVGDAFVACSVHWVYFQRSLVTEFVGTSIIQMRSIFFQLFRVRKKGLVCNSQLNAVTLLVSGIVYLS